MGWLGQQEIWGRGFSKRPPATAASLVPNADPGTLLPLLSEARGRAQATTFLRSSSEGCDAQLDLKTTGLGPSVFSWADGTVPILCVLPTCPQRHQHTRCPFGIRERSRTRAL